jgi:hypothetical protein
MHSRSRRFAPATFTKSFFAAAVKQTSGKNRRSLFAPKINFPYNGRNFPRVRAVPEECEICT